MKYVLMYCIGTTLKMVLQPEDQKDRSHRFSLLISEKYRKDDTYKRGWDENGEEVILWLFNEDILLQTERSDFGVFQIFVQSDRRKFPHRSHLSEGVEQVSQRNYAQDDERRDNQFVYNVGISI